MLVGSREGPFLAVCIPVMKRQIPKRMLAAGTLDEPWSYGRGA